jgi:hypothetical protein
MKAAKRAPGSPARKTIAKSKATGPKEAPVKRGTGKVAKPEGANTWDSSVSLESLRSWQKDFALERQWDQHHTPRNLALAMVGEVRILFALWPVCRQEPHHKHQW